MESLDLEEYRQLRATIRERGSLRVVLFAATMGAWAVTAGLVASFVPLPLASLLPLTLLVSGFEAVHALHVGAERIGRYLYVRYESGSARSAGLSNHSPVKAGLSSASPVNAGLPNDSPLMWEGAIAAFGAGHRPSTRPAGALFPLLFTTAIIVNFLITALGATTPELAGIGAVHALALVRVLAAQRAAAGQRAEDQKRFEAVLKR